MLAVLSYPLERRGSRGKSPRTGRRSSPPPASSDLGDPGSGSWGRRLSTAGLGGGGSPGSEPSPALPVCGPPHPHAVCAALFGLQPFRRRAIVTPVFRWGHGGSKKTPKQRADECWSPRALDCKVFPHPCFSGQGDPGGAAPQGGEACRGVQPAVPVPHSQPTSPGALSKGTAAWVLPRTEGPEGTSKVSRMIPMCAPKFGGHRCHQSLAHLQAPHPTPLEGEKALTTPTHFIGGAETGKTEGVRSCPQGPTTNPSAGSALTSGCI